MSDPQELPLPPAATIIERKVSLDGRVLEFPLERWLVSPELVVGRWVADQDPRATSRYPGASGFTSWGVWWPDRPYSAYRLHRPDGSLRIYRLDTVDRVICDGGVVEFHDLLLDALIRPDGEVSIEDEDEVEEALSQGVLGIEQRWRIDWTRNLYRDQAGLLTQRIDVAISEAIEAVRRDAAGRGPLVPLEGAAQSRIEDITQAVADDVEAPDQQRDARAGEDP